jgi:S-adenosylmethionine hydrolase
VIHVDRFGNLVTSIAADEVEALRAAGPVAVRVGGRVLSLVGTYGELPPGGAGALVGSRNRLEIAIRDGSAAASLSGRVGLPVVLSRRTTRSRTLRSRRSP